MEGNDQEQFYQDLWTSQEERPIEMTTNEVCAGAHKYEKDGLLVYRGAWVLTAVLLLKFGYNLTRVQSPWIIAGMALTLAAYGCMVWELIWNGPNRMAPAEPCRDYLRRQLAAKRQGVLRIRNCVLLLVPALLSSWWGQRPAAVTPWILLGVCVPFLWYSFWHQARKFQREIASLEKE